MNKVKKRINKHLKVLRKNKVNHRVIKFIKNNNIDVPKIKSIKGKHHDRYLWFDVQKVTPTTLKLCSWYMPLDYTSKIEDDRGNILYVKHINGNEAWASYDSNNNMTHYTECSGHNISFTYNEDGDLIEVMYNNNWDNRDIYSYDKYNNLSYVYFSDDYFVNEIYDSKHNIVLKRETLNGVTTTKEYKYIYDKKGRLTCITTDGVPTYTIKYK